MAADEVIVGRVGRPHGRDGSFVVEHASHDARRFEVGAVLHAGGEPARVVSSKVAGGRRAIRLNRVVARGTELFVPRSDLSPPAEGSYYVHDLVGCVVEEEDGRELGRVTEVEPGVANDVLELDSGVIVPLHEACVREIDLEAGRIVVARGFADAG